MTKEVGINRMAKMLRQRVYRGFVIRHFLIHVALVTFICFEFFDVFVRLLFGFTAFVLNDFTQRCVDVLGHSAGVAADKKMRAFGFHPFPNLVCAIEYFVLDVGFLGRVTRPGAVAAGKKFFSLIVVELLAVKIIAVLMLRSEEQPVFSFCTSRFALL